MYAEWAKRPTLRQWAVAYFKYDPKPEVDIPGIFLQGIQQRQKSQGQISGPNPGQNQGETGEVLKTIGSREIMNFIKNQPQGKYKG